MSRWKSTIVHGTGVLIGIYPANLAHGIQASFVERFSIVAWQIMTDEEDQVCDVTPITHETLPDHWCIEERDCYRFPEDASVPTLDAAIAHAEEQEARKIARNAQRIRNT